MAETGQLAAWVGREKGFEIREYPVPDPVPVAALVNEAFRQQEDATSPLAPSR
jgi:hypothetical protein